MCMFLFEVKKTNALLRKDWDFRQRFETRLCKPRDHWHNLTYPTKIYFSDHLSTTIRLLIEITHVWPVVLSCWVVSSMWPDKRGCKDLIDSAMLMFSLMSCSLRKPPPSYKAAVTANGSAKKKHKDDKRADLWINHSDNVEMKPLFNNKPDATNIPRYLIDTDSFRIRSCYRAVYQIDSGSSFYRNLWSTK